MRRTHGCDAILLILRNKRARVFIDERARESRKRTAPGKRALRSLGESSSGLRGSRSIPTLSASRTFSPSVVPAIAASIAASGPTVVPVPVANAPASVSIAASAPASAPPPSPAIASVATVRWYPPPPPAPSRLRSLCLPRRLRSHLLRLRLCRLVRDGLSSPPGRCLCRARWRR